MKYIKGDEWLNNLEEENRIYQDKKRGE